MMNHISFENAYKNTRDIIRISTLEDLTAHLKAGSLICFGERSTMFRLTGNTLESFCCGEWSPSLVFDSIEYLYKVNKNNLFYILEPRT